MKIITVKGNTVMQNKKYTHKHGRFIFMLCKNGTFYLDTTIGIMWKLDKDEQLDPAHLQIVRENT